ncbi:LOW QUALITY PROTEIN: hypothetical protein MARPO_0153s0007 [Marchantia polymorpha]|uniref:HAT C-terminal dimerisation domain-containing protein n=1 Tax=Marchantia polymorpha TaxID=3197 RepID=A0A2R6W4P5_MARPO|nr:LOW QUALITY PROTEIN: hypothetical protein MARPO_0153s0007 [Marchantia polymorpha]|eukprot:PTQ28836.1 LOW QUALITY PROTEIN: hypothetical protein MARPO_0153s0007 [Marchantia polymorpha]
MNVVLSKSAVLLEALQRKYQDILHAMYLVVISKYELHEMKLEKGWKTIYEAVKSFCLAKNISAHHMESSYVLMGRPCCNAHNFFQHRRFTLNELHDRFPECLSALLTWIAYLCPNHLRIYRNVPKLVELGRMYLHDFELYDLVILILSLLVSTTSIEHSFSALKIVKMRLRNKMGDGYLDDTITLIVERDLAQRITTDYIIEKFQALSTKCL